MRKKYLSEYFSFTRKERTGIIVIVSLIIIFTLLPFLFPYFISSKPPNHAAFEKDIASLTIKEQDSSSRFEKQYYTRDNRRADYPGPENDDDYKQPTGELFYFDPNTLTADGWKKLGIREKTIKTILNYVSKGGKFYKPEDIAKIWGLHEDEIKRLLPFVAIPQKEMAPFPEKKAFEKKIYKITPVDINLADTSAFIALPGIGSKLAARIIAFRDKLGGFYKTEQIAETYALPDSTFQKIKSSLILSGLKLKQININTATVDELKVHPYIRYALANALVQYRNEHGKFVAVADIRKIMMVTDSSYKKLTPYLTVQ